MGQELQPGVRRRGHSTPWTHSGASLGSALALGCALLLALPAHGRALARRASPHVIRHDQAPLGRLPAGPKILVIGSSSAASSFGELRSGVKLGRSIAGWAGWWSPAAARG